jgi:hypothetical protein
VRGHLVRADSTDENSLPELLARLKNSVELGSLGELVKKADPLPGGSWQRLAQIGETFSHADTAERFLSFPGARELSRHPRVVALEQDPEIARLAREGRFFELLQNPRVIEALNDPTLIDRIKHFDLNGALEYATGAKQEAKPR